MTLQEVKKMENGNYTDIEVYRSRFGNADYHTDNIESIDENDERYPKDTDSIMSYWVMGDYDYNTTILSNTGVFFNEFYRNGDKILVILI